MKEKAEVIYQFIVLFAIIGLLSWQLYTTKELNEILLGALIGVMVGIVPKMTNK